MPPELTFSERRVLGALIEKGFTTPDQYPLTLNGVVVGSNQKSCRDPVASLDEEAALDSLDSLRQKGFAICVRMEGSRADRWKHRAGECLELEARELAVLAELLLRGPQTDGELRQRASRMVTLSDLREVETVLGSLISREDPLIQRLGPPGKKRGIKFAHTLYPQDERPAVQEGPLYWSETHASAAEIVPSAAASRIVMPTAATVAPRFPTPRPPAPGHPASSSEGSPATQAGEHDSAPTDLLSDLRERIRALENRVEELEATFVKFLR